MQRAALAVETLPSRRHADVASREQAADALNDVLATTLELGLQARQSHWNVTGPMFAALHRMFGDLAKDLDEIADDVAERVVQLGGIAEATTRSIQRRVSLNPAPAGMDGDTHVAILATAVSAAAAACRHAIDDLSHHRDPVTIDILTDAARRLENWLWYLEAHCVDHT